MIFVAYFEDQGVPATGLTPSIDIYRVDTGAQVVTAQSMTELAGGWYKYDYTGYTDTLDYVAVADGGATLSNVDRYKAASNEVKAATDEAEDNIRGSDNDDLKDISDQMDTAQADLNNPDQYKADVSALALEANVQGHAAAALTAYDPPTRSEATADKDEVLVAVAAVLTAVGLLPTAVQIKDAVWQEPFAGYTTVNQMGYLMNKFLRALIQGNMKQENNQWIIYDPDSKTTPLVTFNTYKEDLVTPADEEIYLRDKV